MPSLQRWYLHRKAASISAYLFFSEPVTLTNVSNIAVYRNKKTAAGKPDSFGTPSMTLYDNATAKATAGSATPLGLKYSNYNRQVSFDLLNYCTDQYSDSFCLSSTDPWQNLFAFLNQTSSPSFGYFLTLGMTVVEDFALIPNPSQMISERNQVLEGTSGILLLSCVVLLGTSNFIGIFAADCSTCGAGQYVSRNCTATTDRECKACSSCLSGQYAAEVCSLYHDTSCAGKANSACIDLFPCVRSPYCCSPVCSNCGYGNYIAAACSAKANTQCAFCHTCGPLQYVARPCELGRDVLCNSCTYCSFPDAEITAACEADKLYRPWQEANCCTGPKGKKVRHATVGAIPSTNPNLICLVCLFRQVECKDVDRAQLLQTSIDGRHHWTFPGSTSPRIDTKRIPNIQFPRPF